MKNKDSNLHIRIAELAALNESNLRLIDELKRENANLVKIINHLIFVCDDKK